MINNKMLIFPGIDRLCLCSSQGKLFFYQLSEDVPDQSDSVVEGELTPVAEFPDSVFPGDTVRPEENVEQSPKASSKLNTGLLIYLT